MAVSTANGGWNQNFVGPILTDRTDNTGGGATDVPEGFWLNMWADNRTGGIRKEGDFAATQDATDPLLWTVGTNNPTQDTAIVPSVSTIPHSFNFPVVLGSAYTVNLTRPNAVGTTRYHQLWIAIREDTPVVGNNDRRSPRMVHIWETTDNLEPDLPASYTAGLLLHSWTVAGGQSGAVVHTDERVVSTNLDKCAGCV